MFLMVFVAITEAALGCAHYLVNPCLLHITQLDTVLLNAVRRKGPVKMSIGRKYLMKISLPYQHNEMC